MKENKKNFACVRKIKISFFHSNSKKKIHRRPMHYKNIWIFVSSLIVMSSTLV